MAEQGLAWSLPRVVGLSTALDLLFSARVISAPEARELGLVDRVFEGNDLMSGTMEYARNLVQYSSPVAMGTMKRQVYAAQESSQEEARALALRYWVSMLREHPDFEEGIASYLENRPPNFAPWDVATPGTPRPLTSP
jgi:enoyl-CoA hydratase/carnithine racemase